MTGGSLTPFLPETIDILTSSLLSTTQKLVKASSSALFNISRLCLEESHPLAADEFISIVVALVESLRTVLEKDAPEEKELERLLIVCLGGFMVLGRGMEGVKEVLGGVEASDVLGRSKMGVAKEVVELIGA